MQFCLVFEILLYEVNTIYLRNLEQRMWQDLNGIMLHIDLVRIFQSFSQCVIKQIISL